MRTCIASVYRFYHLCCTPDGLFQSKVGLSNRFGAKLCENICGLVQVKWAKLPQWSLQIFADPVTQVNRDGDDRTGCWGGWVVWWLFHRHLGRSYRNIGTFQQTELVKLKNYFTEENLRKINCIAFWLARIRITYRLLSPTENRTRNRILNLLCSVYKKENVMPQSA